MTGIIEAELDGYLDTCRSYLASMQDTDDGPFCQVQRYAHVYLGIYHFDHKGRCSAHPLGFPPRRQEDGR